MPGEPDPFGPPIQPNLDRGVAVGPDVPLESWRLTVPGGAGCYLLADEDEQPVLLATAAGMRQVVVHRLTTREDELPSKRTDYRAVVRRVLWRRTYSRFEADWVFLENVRQLYPRQYANMIRKWRGHWLHIDMADDHPRLVATTTPPTAGSTLGPLPTASAARATIQTLQDVFDLCRYHEILVQAPHGQACAYKEMGKCPAPCDGTVSMDHYRGQLDEAIDMLAAGPGPWIERLTEAMQAASRELAFEQAARLKWRIDAAAKLKRPELRWCRPLEQARWLSVQRGSHKGAARLFAVLGPTLRFLGELPRRDMNAQIEWVAANLPPLLQAPIEPIDTAGAERLGLVAWCLSRGDREPGVWLDANTPPTPRVLAEAVEQVNAMRESSGESPDQDDRTSDASDSSAG